MNDREGFAGVSSCGRLGLSVTLFGLSVNVTGGGDVSSGISDSKSRGILLSHEEEEEADESGEGWLDRTESLQW